MKSFPRFSVIAAIVATIALAGCKDDVYEPGKIRPIPPAENPFGEDFKAPDGFDWSMIKPIKLNVEVKDEFNGNYEYLVEVFTANPLNDTTALPIAAGYAKSGETYSTEIDIAKTTAKLYIRQTDPKQRKEIYEFTIPENSGTLNCKLYYTATSTKAVTRSGDSNSAYEAAKSAGIIEPEVPDYTDDIDIPSQSDQPINSWPGGMVFKDGANFIIDGTRPFTDQIQVENKSATEIGRMSIYVKGVWQLSSIQYPFDIYILDGGKIINPNGGIILGNQTNLTIAEGGLLKANGTFDFQSILVKNFGTIEATLLTNNSGDKNAIFYNDGKISVDKISLNGITFYNCESIETEQLDLIDINFINKDELDIDGNISMNGGSLFNHDKISFDDKNGRLWTNNSNKTVIVNHDKASIKGYEIGTGLALYNDGIVETSILNSNNSSDLLYNGCTIIAKEYFSFRILTLNKGSITGAKEDDVWNPVPNILSATDSKFTLIDGSIIKASNFTVLSGNVIFSATNESNTVKSMIKAKELNITEPTNAQLLGNLIVEGQITGLSENAQLMKNESVNAAYDESQYTIEACAGVINPGNEGSSTPETPDYPIEIGDANSYTYAFEDQWPVYGDYDMNDIVLTIDKIKIKSNDDKKYVKEVEIKGKLKAVGASKTLGIGIQFLGLSNGVKVEELELNDDKVSFEDGNFHPTLIICEDAHRFMNNSQNDNAFINTEIGGNTSKEQEYEIEIEFENQDVKPEDLNINKLDVFIYCKKGAYVPNRREIHLAGYAPTALADQSFSSASNDDGKNHFTSHENLAWGICIPSNKWNWPQELIIITDVYRDFKSWISSGGASDADWWKNNNIDKDKLYYR